MPRRWRARNRCRCHTPKISRIQPRYVLWYSSRLFNVKTIYSHLMSLSKFAKSAAKKETNAIREDRLNWMRQENREGYVIRIRRFRSWLIAVLFQYRSKIVPRTTSGRRWWEQELFTWWLEYFCASPTILNLKKSGRKAKSSLLKKVLSSLRMRAGAANDLWVRPVAERNFLKAFYFPNRCASAAEFDFLSCIDCSLCFVDTTDKNWVEH